MSHCQGDSAGYFFSSWELLNSIGLLIHLLYLAPWQWLMLERLCNKVFCLEGWKMNFVLD